MTTALATRVFGAVDALDARAFAAFFAPDGWITFGNGEPLVGPAAIEEGTAAFLGTLGGISHEIVNEWVADHGTVCELRVTYTRTDDRKVTIPVTSIWTVGEDGLFAAYRIHFDVAPVFA